MQLRRAAAWYDDVSGVVTTVVGGTTSTETDDFIRAVNTLLDTEPLRVTAGELTELQATFDELKSIVGDRSPSDVTAIGVVPSDHESLDSELERLAGRYDLSIERTETGVIVR